MPQPRKYQNRADQQAAYRHRTVQAQAAQLAQRGLPALPALPTMPGHRRWDALLRQAQWALQTMHAEMESYQAQRSEAWQESERGEIFLEKLDEVAQALDTLSDLSPLNGGDACLTETAHQTGYIR